MFPPPYQLAILSVNIICAVVLGMVLIDLYRNKEIPSEKRMIWGAIAVLTLGAFSAGSFIYGLKYFKGKKQIAVAVLLALLIAGVAYRFTTKPSEAEIEANSDSNYGITSLDTTELSEAREKINQSEIHSVYKEEALQMLQQLENEMSTKNLTYKEKMADVELIRMLNQMGRNSTIGLPEWNSWKEKFNGRIVPKLQKEEETQE